MEQIFDSAVPYYANYRAGYPQELVDLLVARAGVDNTHRVLDIGCGTGQIAIPLARRTGSVIAIDPVAEMLAHGRAAARRAGVDNIDWRQGHSTGLARLGAAGARLAVFAASFHWVDRPAVLRDLDRLLETDGVVVVIGDGLPDDEQPDWARAIDEIRARYLGPRRRTVLGDCPSDPLPHREVLEDSPFSDVGTVVWAWRRELSVSQVVGLQFSYSFSTPALFGARADDFAGEVRRAVLALHPSGTVTEPLAVEALITRRAWRSGPAPR